MRVIITFSVVILHFYQNLYSQVFFTEDFQNPIINMVNGAPPGILNDTNWYNYDQDALLDGSGEARPGNWYKKYAFALADSLTITGDTNFIFASNSKFSSPGKARNWLITPSISVTPFTTISFKSATYTTPFKLDGFKVLVSTTTNDTSAFTDTVFVASEYTGPGNIGSDFALYNFSSYTNWIQGWDGFTIQMAELEYLGDSSQWRGVLTEHFSNCAFTFQSIYVAFVHDSFDDNLISLDDIGVFTCGLVESNEQTEFFILNPNPFSEEISLSLINPNLLGNEFSFYVSDQTGRKIMSKNIESQNTSIQLSQLSKGIYTLTIFKRDEIIQTKKIVKN